MYSLIMYGIKLPLTVTVKACRMVYVWRVQYTENEIFTERNEIQVY